MKIIFTKTFLKNFDNNLDYLRGNWTNKEEEKFIENLKKTLKIIQKFPEIGSYDNNIDSNKILISKNFYLFYDIDFKNKEIVITNLWNNYRKPLF